MKKLFALLLLTLPLCLSAAADRNPQDGISGIHVTDTAGDRVFPGDATNNAVRTNLVATITQPVSHIGLTSIITGQQAVTATATVLPSSAGKVVCMKVKDGGTQTIYYGPTGITTSTGMELLVGESVCRSLDNSNRIFVIAGSTGSTVSFEVLN